MLNILSRCVILTHLVRSIREPITINHAVDVYRGSKAVKIVNMRHDQLAAFGKGASMKRSECERLFHFLLAKDIISEYHQTKAGFTHAYVKLGKEARLYQDGNRPLQFQFLSDDSTPKPKSKKKLKSRSVTEMFEQPAEPEPKKLARSSTWAAQPNQALPIQTHAQPRQGSSAANQFQPEPLSDAQQHCYKCLVAFRNSVIETHVDGWSLQGRP